MSDRTRAKHWTETHPAFGGTRDHFFHLDEAIVENGHIVWTGWQDGPPNGAIRLDEIAWHVEDVENAIIVFFMKNGDRISLKIMPDPPDGGEMYVVLQEGLWEHINQGAQS